MRIQRLRLAAVITALVAAARGLHGLAAVDGFALPWGDVRALLDAPLEDLAGALLRLAALAGVYWVLATTVLYVLARALGAGRLVRAAGWAALPAVRRIADRAVGMALLSAMVGPAPVWAIVPPEPAAPDPQVQTVTEAALPPLPVTLPVGGMPQQAPPRPGEHVVVPGDHLWGIAAAVAPDDTAPYWVQLVTANADRLPSGDPDLVYPGDVVLLPTPDGS